MANRNRIPTVFSIYMLDVICCALGCVILLWQVAHMEAEQQTEEAKLAQERWKLASTEVDSGTARIESLRTALDEANRIIALRKKEFDALSIDMVRTVRDLDNANRVVAVRSKEFELLSIKMARTAKNLEEANRVIALRKKEYDTLRDAWLLSEALLKGSRGDLEKLRDQHKLAALELASKIKTNAELLLRIAVADKKTMQLEKLATAQKIDAQEAAKRLQEQLARLQSIEAKNKDLDKQASDLRGDKKDALNKVAISALRVKVLEQDLDKAKKDLMASAEQIEAFQKQFGAISRAVDDTKATIASLQGDTGRRGPALCLHRLDGEERAVPRGHVRQHGDD
jgi:chromosome segregation ATPase